MCPTEACVRVFEKYLWGLGVLQGEAKHERGLGSSFFFCAFIRMAMWVSRRCLY